MSKREAGSIRASFIALGVMLVLFMLSMLWLVYVTNRTSLEDHRLLDARTPLIESIARDVPNHVQERKDIKHIRSEVEQLRAEVMRLQLHSP